jgi:hypothetical protein
LFRYDLTHHLAVWRNDDGWTFLLRRCVVCADDKPLHLGGSTDQVAPPYTLIQRVADCIVEVQDD